MPSISTKSFTQVVSDFATAVQGSASALVDFQVGSIMLAIGEAMGGCVVWLESLILLLLQTTRLASSSGADVDSFVADFGLTRLPANFADGPVLFSRFTPTSQAQIPPGVQVTTADGTQSYLIIADTTQAAWNTSLNAYVIPAGTSSCVATALAVNAGTAGNVSANTITVIGSAIPYVDTVTNALPLVNGANAETDTALRIRFVTYIASLSKATKLAIINAVLALQVGATCVLTENNDYNGTYDPGSFYAVVDDGSGAPPSTFLSSAFTAIDVTRACGIRPAVFAPITIAANVSMVVQVQAGYALATVCANVASAIQVYLQSLQLGQSASWAYLAAIAFSTAGVADVNPGWTLNGGAVDVTPTAQQRIIAGTVVVT